jgi:hypothetical protein
VLARRGFDVDLLLALQLGTKSISIAVQNAAGKVVMECVIETKASMILRFIGLRGDARVTFEKRGQNGSNA